MGCAVVGCESQDRLKRGFCDKHYNRFRRYGDPLGGRRFNEAPPEDGICTAEGCDRPVVARSVCMMHYVRLSNHGSVNGGKFHHSPKRREWHLDSSTGYIWRYDPGNIHAIKSGYVYQHREIVGEQLGRRLLKTESAHHKNGNKTDNRPENLELWFTGQPAGQRAEDLVAYATGILQHFTPDVMARLKQLSRGAGS